MGGLSNTEKYLQRHHVDGSPLPLRHDVPDIIVVIPCYDEPDIMLSLATLQSALMGNFVVEVIVVVNSGERSADAVVKQNRSTYEQLNALAYSWGDGLLISPVLLENVRHKHAGVGYARKIGMDLAVWRFYQCENKAGIIASLDADTRVASNYFTALQEAFSSRPKLYGAIVKFEHDIDGDTYTKQVYEAIMHYELHLRYVNQALKISSFPYVYHTVGSAFAVRASAYVSHGGMNRRQGGEDFYFLHKLFPHGEFVTLNSTAVFPSSRPSMRVPFGTGPQVCKYLEANELTTYSLSAFLELKQLVDKVPSLYEKDVLFTECVRDFLATIDFEMHLAEIRKNSASEASFIKRFFQYFDAFTVVKFLNFSHQDYFTKNDVCSEARDLLASIGEVSPVGVRELLMTYRKVEGR